MMQLYVMLKGATTDVAVVVTEVRMSLTQLRYDTTDGETGTIAVADIAYMEVKHV